MTLLWSFLVLKVGHPSVRRMFMVPTGGLKTTLIYGFTSSNRIQENTPVHVFNWNAYLNVYFCAIKNILSAIWQNYIKQTW